MDKSELIVLLSAEGLRLLDSLPEYESTDDVVRTVDRLRKEGRSPELVAAVLTQSKLRRRARHKLGPFADRMLFTEPGLEQATRLPIAALHAQRFRAAGLPHVADLGCGIGVDAMAMAGIDLKVTAIERDEVTAAIAAYNLAPWPDSTVINTDAEDIGIAEFDALYLDPARRSGARRLVDPADWTPSLDFAFEVARQKPTGIKLSPAIDRDLIPVDAEAQWISDAGEVVELGLWFGAVARSGIRRSALVIGPHGAAELTAAEDSADAELGQLGEYLYEPDGAVIRARLIGDLARRIGARMVSERIAWLTSDAAVDSPFASRFRVVEEFPFDVKTLKRELAARRIGTLEIKKRGADIDPAELRKKLAPKGEHSATLIITRIAGRHRAVLAERD
ncbi:MULTISPECIES: class I SAM-dependent methyltransferase [unclassified Cryobacterium]|uniref:THUMP-like domain-containing protein n=1 Tax=unclassified Cryobacterium TaxID=2649013 RepID=UPI0014482EEF|nr:MULTISPECIES: class I SAM-dependent methyltransferase [unclassified Cryobacterium]